MHLSKEREKTLDKLFQFWTGSILQTKEYFKNGKRNWYDILNKFI